jgi:hypothetical protein
MPPLTLTDFRRMGPTERDNDNRRKHLLNTSEHPLPVSSSPGFWQIKHKLNNGPPAPPLGSNGLPERRIGRWNYTIVPWED